LSFFPTAHPQQQNLQTINHNAAHEEISEKHTPNEWPKTLNSLLESDSSGHMISDYTKEETLEMDILA
jgi:hypothetical protein